MCFAFSTENKWRHLQSKWAKILVRQASLAYCPLQKVESNFISFSEGRWTERTCFFNFYFFFKLKKKMIWIESINWQAIKHLAAYRHSVCECVTRGGSPGGQRFSIGHRSLMSSSPLCHRWHCCTGVVRFLTRGRHAKLHSTCLCRWLHL